jgi:DNA topoisomerase-1
MPRKKQKKSKEEKTAEEFFPVDEEDLKYAVEKPVKEMELETVEKTGRVKKAYKRKTSVKKAQTRKKSSGTSYKPSKKAFNKIKEYSPPEISLKKNGYELIITEKPQAALKIADALGKSAKKNNHGVPYYEVQRDSKKIIVACAVGHLFTLKQESNNSLPVFDIKWVPNFLVRKADFTKKYYDTLLSLAKGAGAITVATDYDIEGEVIGLNVVRFICNQADASRMKFSTLTNNELNEAYEKKSKSIDWGQAIAGETRHYLDWFYGINLSRALMNAIKTTGRFKIMSIGRVQGPALNLIVQKEREIQKFVSTLYWQVFITVKNSHEIELKHIKDITKKSDLENFENLKGKTGIAETKKSQQKIPPQAPFNLTTLQTEAYKFYGFTPSRTLQIAQSLYLGGLISYPRTSSQKLPAAIGYNEILQKLAKKYNVAHLIKRKKPIEGNKSDPAHPSIYPTGQNSDSLSKEEEKLYNLIVKRFLSLFCEDAVIDNKTIRVNVDNLIFSTRGSEIKNKGWMEIYPTKINEKDIPDLEGEVKVINSRTEEKETQPPKRFSPASIVSELEKRNLGTKATRANILETLYDRDYIREKSIQATPFGVSLISTLEKYSPIIIDEKLTRHFEKEMESIQGSKKFQTEKEKKIIDEAKITITKILDGFVKNERKIGDDLLKGNDKVIEQQREENTLTQCPVCKKGNLRILYNKNFKRYFVGCSNYPECKTTFSLPPGMIKNASKSCGQCNFPKLIRIQKGKRPWEFCFNPECPSRKQKEEQ